VRPGVEGSAAAVVRMVRWLRGAFHWAEVGLGPVLLGLGDALRQDFHTPVVEDAKALRNGLVR